jgi:hypothetical protein
VVDHFSLFVCLLFRFETRDSGKDEWPKKIKWPAKHFARYSPIVNPPKQAASSPKCTGFMFFFLPLYRDEHSSLFCLSTRIGSLGRSLRVPIYQM